MHLQKSHFSKLNFNPYALGNIFQKKSSQQNARISLSDWLKTGNLEGDIWSISRKYFFKNCYEIEFNDIRLFIVKMNNIQNQVYKNFKFSSVKAI